jgi:hypothetical protein
MKTKLNATAMIVVIGLRSSGRIVIWCMVQFRLLACPTSREEPTRSVAPTAAESDLPFLLLVVGGRRTNDILRGIGRGTCGSVHVPAALNVSAAYEQSAHVIVGTERQ